MMSYKSTLALLGICTLFQGFLAQRNYMKVCYFSSWAQARPVPGTFTVDNIDPALCTHIIYLFAVLDLSATTIKPLNSTVDISRNFYRQFTMLPAGNPNLTAMIGIGGYTTNELNNYASLLNTTEENMNKFAKSVSDFCYLYNFKGVDFNIEYLEASVTKSNLTKFIDILSDELRQHRFTFSLTVSFRKQTIDKHYNVRALNRTANFVNVMAVDMHGPWEDKADHHAPLFKRPFETIAIINADFSVNYLTILGLLPSKINMAIPLYGRSFTLTDPSVTKPPAPASGPGPARLYTAERGFFAYYEICLNLFGFTIVQDPVANFGPYAYSHNTWIGYDDKAMAVRKALYVTQKKLGGVAFWDITLDDFHGLCRDGKNPLMQAVKDALETLSMKNRTQVEDRSSKQPSRTISATVASELQTKRNNASVLTVTDSLSTKRETTETTATSTSTAALTTLTEAPTTTSTPTQTTASATTTTTAATTTSDTTAATKGTETGSLPIANHTETGHINP